MVALGTVVPFQNGGVIQGVFSEFALHASVSFEVTSYSASTVKQGEMIVSGSGTAVWDMSAHATDPENHPDRGSFALNVFATGNQIPLGDGAVWAHAQGNLTGTLPAETNTGASGDIQPTQAMRTAEAAAGYLLAGRLLQSFQNWHHVRDDDLVFGPASGRFDFNQSRQVEYTQGSSIEIERSRVRQ
jgi:hypothetical protein